MVKSLKEILFFYFFENKLYLDDKSELNTNIFNINYEYKIWKYQNIKLCNICLNIGLFKLSCDNCSIYYYCDDCYYDYSFRCPSCNKSVCFLCDIKRRLCINCFYLRKSYRLLN